MQRTIIDIQAHDQIGLLYRLAKVIYDHGFDITFARINTERGVALDTFYIESANHEPTEDTARLHALRDSLARVIKPAPPPAVSDTGLRIPDTGRASGLPDVRQRTTSGVAVPALIRESGVEITRGDPPSPASRGKAAIRRPASRARSRVSDSGFG